MVDMIQPSQKTVSPAADNLRHEFLEDHFRMIKTFCAVAAALLLLTTRASAHHAFAAMYDEHRLVTVSGIVTKLDWVNPHVLLYVDGKDEKGKAGRWRFEMGSPGGLISRGWENTTLKPGDQITVDGYRAKDGSKVANPRNVTLPDGRKLFGGFQSTPGAPVK